MRNRNVLNSPRLLELKKERRRIFRSKILLCVLAFLAFFFLLIYLYRIPEFNISSVEISGNKITDTGTIEATVKSAISGNYFWFFPKSNVLFYPKGDIKNKLQSKFKGLKDVTLSIKNKRVLEVSLSERVGLYTWCGTTPPEETALSGQNSNDNSQKCYFLDKAGYIFDEAPYFSGDVYFKFYGSALMAPTGGLIGIDSGVPSPSYFSPDIFSKLILFKEALQNIGLKPVALYVEDGGDIKMFLSPGTSLPTGPEIIFNVDSDFQKIEENLEAALTTEPLQSDFKNKYSSLQYIDLRFGNKVYYKFR